MHPWSDEDLYTEHGPISKIEISTEDPATHPHPRISSFRVSKMGRSGTAVQAVIVEYPVRKVKYGAGDRGSWSPVRGAVVSSTIQSVELGPGDNITKVEGYSGKYVHALKFHWGCE